MDSQNRQVQAVAISNGKIVGLGSILQVEKEMKDLVYQKINLKGKTLLPGFIDSHLHVFSSAILMNWVDLGPFDGLYLKKEYSLQSLLEALKQKVKQPGFWITGYGIDPSLMKVWAFINNKMLDQICQVKPIFLLNASGHIGYANSKAIHLAGLDTKSHGVFLESQIKKIIRVIPIQHNLKNLIKNILSILNSAASQGVTSLLEASLGSVLKDHEFTIFARLFESNLVPQRICGALLCQDLKQLNRYASRFKPGQTLTQDRLFSLQFLKLIADGSNQGLTGFQMEPYEFQDDSIQGKPYGIYNFTQQGRPLLQTNKHRLSDYLQQAFNAGWSVMVHANGDHALNNILQSFQRLGSQQLNLRQLRNRVEHCSLLDDESIKRISSLHLSPSFLIGHVGYWGHIFSDKIFSSDKALRIDRCKSVLAANLKFSLHSDHFVTPISPLRMIQQAVKRVMQASSTKQILNCQERISVFQGLKAVTIDAAWHCKIDQITGSLKQGKQADLLILQNDPFFFKGDLRQIRIVETWRGGVKVFG